MARESAPSATNVRKILKFAYSILLVSAALTLAMVRVLSPSSLKAGILFSLWLLFPHALMAILTPFLSGSRLTSVANFTVTLVASLGGLILLADVIFFHPDAQGPIAIILVPVIQAAGIVVLTPIARVTARLYFGRRRRSKS
ncbi:MAG: hypothetical protein KIT79_09590 [Deltaproteobacteria bacterium]|nr:hypothetical protein [Deltaproteobacteria bacterium]